MATGFINNFNWLRTNIVFKITNLIKYFIYLSVKFHNAFSISGFFLFLVLFSQLYSGVMLSFSLVPEAMLIPQSRDEEDMDDLYIDEFFWFHERGVDFLFVFVYVHMFKKLTNVSFKNVDEMSWKSGVWTFLILQATTFFGLILCCTHLSQITLTIAANFVHTFTFFVGKLDWALFTDRYLNTDTIIRCAYIHYILGFYMFGCAFIHSLDMHYNWKSEATYSGVRYELTWNDETFKNEIFMFIKILLFFFLLSLMYYSNVEPLSYELFMWGDIGLVNDVRYYGVAPHWYFRPYMAWLLVCPYHKLGLFGMIYYFWILYHQPTLHGDTSYKIKNFNKNNKSSYTLHFNDEIYKFSLIRQFTIFFFFMCILYTLTFLPFGKYYNRLGGNTGFLLSYFYIFTYLTFNVSKVAYIYYSLLIWFNLINNINNPMFNMKNINFSFNDENNSFSYKYQNNKFWYIIKEEKINLNNTHNI